MSQQYEYQQMAPPPGYQVQYEQPEKKSKKEDDSFGSRLALFFAFIIIVIILLIYWDEIKAFYVKATLPPYVPPTVVEQKAYIDRITQKDEGLKILNALSAGTGTESMDQLLEYEVCFILYPKKDFYGWDMMGQTPDPYLFNYGTGEPARKSDGTLHMLNFADFSFINDMKGEEGGFDFTEKDGAKSIVFAEQIDGAKRFYFNSFKVTRGTVLMITTRDLNGRPTSTGFLLQGKNCQDMEQMLKTFPELTKGNNGIQWDRAQNGTKWWINPLNPEHFRRQMRNKFNRCMDIANGIGGSGGRDNTNEDWRFGLHYIDGTRIAGRPGIKFGGEGLPGDPDNLAIGRWIYDYKCNPIINPATDKQAYRLSGSGYGYSCPESMEYCKYDTQSIVNFANFSQLGLSSDGYPIWTGFDDVPGGYIVTQEPLTDEQIIAGTARQGELQRNQIGWTSETSVPIAPDVLSGIMAGEAVFTPEVAGEVTADPLAPPVSASRFAASKSQFDMNESFTDSGHRNGYIDIPKDTYNLKYAAHLM